MPMPRKQMCKSLKELSLNFVTRHLPKFYERYEEERIGGLDFVGPFDLLSKQVLCLFISCYTPRQ